MLLYALHIGLISTYAYSKTKLDMMLWEAVLVFLCVGALSLWVYHRLTAPQYNLPPGPIPRLFTGNYNLIIDNDRAHIILANLSAKYGELFSFRLGLQQAVVLNSFNAIREAFVRNSDCFSDRPRSLFVHLFRGFSSSTVGVVLSNGETWKVMRKFLMSSLKQLGMGKDRGEEIIQDETQHLICELSKNTHKPLDLTSYISSATMNVVMKLVCNNRFDYKDIHSFAQTADQILCRVLSCTGVMKLRESFMPWLLPHSILFKQGAIAMIAKDVNNLKILIKEQIDDHCRTFDADNVQDLIECYMKAKKNGTLSSAITEPNFLELLIDMYSAGHETSKQTVMWAILYMIHYPQVQTKCRNEIKEAIGQTQICFADQNHLAYTSATLYETQRLSPVGPLGVSHAASKDVIFMGYDIPEGTLIIPNIYAAMRDPDQWENPDEFQPERWLDETNNIRRREEFIPFGIGPRVCAGEGLAKVETFILFSNLLQNFTFDKVDPNGYPPTMDGILGTALQPNPFEVVIKPALNG